MLIEILYVNLHMSHLTRKPVFAICQQQKRRSACAFVQSDQPFVVRCYDSIIPILIILAISTISRLLASEVEQTSLSLTCSQTLKAGFLVSSLILFVHVHQDLYVDQLL